MTKTYRIEKRAIDVQPDDVLCGPSIDFTERGIVQNTVVVDKGVQINYVGGMHIVRPEDYILYVEERA